MRLQSTITVLFVLLAGAALAQNDTGFTAGSTNLLLAANGGKIMSFSSQRLDENRHPVPQWQVSNLIDGQFVTGTYRPENSCGWSADKPPTPAAPAWIVFAIAKEETRLLSRLAIDPTTVDPTLIGRGAKDFELYASITTANGPWALVKRGQLLNKPLKQSFDFLPTEARYLRLVIQSNWGSDRDVQLGEVEAYEAIAGDDMIDSLIVRMESLLSDLKRYRDSIKLNQPLYPELRPAPGTVTPAPAPVAPGPVAPATAPGAPVQ